MKYTQNYHLPQWEKADRILMEDFNAQSAKLEAALTAQGEALAGKADAAQVSGTLAAHTAALAGKAEAASVTAVLWGSYTGNGAASRTITLAKSPFAVLVKKPDNESCYNHTNEVTHTPAFAVRGVTGNVLNVTTNGFTVTSHGLVNQTNQTYIYIAFC